MLSVQVADSYGTLWKGHISKGLPLIYQRPVGQQVLSFIGSYIVLLEARGMSCSRY